LYPLLSLVPGVYATPFAFDDARFRFLLWHTDIVARLGGCANFGPKSASSVVKPLPQADYLAPHLGVLLDQVGDALAAVEHGGVVPPP